jgi:hypothetical protein
MKRTSNTFIALVKWSHKERAHLRSSHLTTMHHNTIMERKGTFLETDSVNLG